MTNTMAVVTAVSRRVGQVTFWPSARTSCKNLNGLIIGHLPRSRVAATTQWTWQLLSAKTGYAWQEWRNRPGL